MGNREVVHTVLGTRAAPQDSSTNPQAVIQGGSTVQPTHLFTTALGLTAPWEVTDVRFDPEAGRIDLEVAFAKGSRFACPACGVQGQPVHDTRERSWQHLSFFKSRAYLHAHLPRVRCEACGKTTQVEAPWARAHSGFTALMEALVVTLCQAMPVATVARHLGVGDERLWGVLDHYVGRARAQEDHSQVSAVGLDETAARREQHYISLFHDLTGKRLLFACEGRDQSTVAAFAADLKAHGGDPQAIEQVCIDLSGAYRAGVARHLPQATVSFDAFHVIKLANEAVDAVRRQEIKTEPALRGTRWTWLKDAHDWTWDQLTDFHWLSRAASRPPVPGASRRRCAISTPRPAPSSRPRAPSGAGIAGHGVAACSP